MCSTARQQLVDDDDAADHAYRFCADYLRRRLTDGPGIDAVIRETADVVSGLVSDAVALECYVSVEIALHRSHVQIAVAAGDSNSISSTVAPGPAGGCGFTRSSASSHKAGDGQRIVLLPVPRTATGAMTCNVSALL
jgi:hypothetical protein